MKETEPKQSLLRWESAAIILTSVGAGYILGSRETRERIGKEIYFHYRGFKNIINYRGLKPSVFPKGKSLFLLRFIRGLKSTVFAKFEIKRRQDKKQVAELELKARKVLTQVFPQGLGAEK